MDLDIDLASVDDLNEPLAISNAITEHTLPSSQIPDNELAPHKVYISGLEDLTTSDIKTFCGEHYPSKDPPRIEWIDDTSANLVFEGEETAMVALRAFSRATDDSESLPSTQLRVAKKLSTHPDSFLYVRIAAVTDQKRPRAYEASRFYMMHPEHDPREQRRQGGGIQGKNAYREKGYSDDERRRRRRKDKEDGFDASMYDDAGASSRLEQISSFSIERGHKKRRNSRIRGNSYRPARHQSNVLPGSRDRSASPNGRHRNNPPPTYRSRDPHPFPHENEGKELFPSIPQSGQKAGRNTKDLFSSKLLTAGVTKRFYPEKCALAREAAPKSRDLFSNRARAAEVKIELFPHKLNSSKQSRSNAADETADLFATRMSVPFMDTSSSHESPIQHLITSGFESQVDDGVVEFGLNIRGASREQQGLSIRGGAALHTIETIKELFPREAAGNAGKELFAEKIDGRGGRRNRAEDMFY